MKQLRTFSDYAARLRDFIRCHSTPNDGGLCASFDDLALALFELQYTHNPAYRRFCESRKIEPGAMKGWTEIPAMPAVAFKEVELTSLPANDRKRVFHSSGTTEQRPGRHYHDAESLSLYEASLLPWFQKHMLPDDGWMFFVSLVPPPQDAPNSSLVHMIGTIHRNFGAADSVITGRIDPDTGWTVDVAKTLAVLRECIVASRPVALMGTAFNFVHLLDSLADDGIQLPTGSRILETGGYKGRSRAVPKPELHSMLTGHLGVPPSHIVSEYGMSELSSQAYDSVVGEIPASGREFRFPPWARAQIISPETGREVGDGETGLIRVFDLANVRSVMAVHTEDLGVRRAGGFELLGRAALAESRGCSLMSP